MNQILDHNPIKNHYDSNSSKSDKIVRVFAIILIAFALTLLIVGGFGLYNNSKTDAPGLQKETLAQIDVTQDKASGILTINVTHDKVIDKIIYSVNSNKETIKSGEGKSTLEAEVQLAVGENKLLVNVVDVDGVETRYEQIFNSEVGADKEIPQIKTEIIGNKLKVIATDETEMQFVTYRWNEDEEIKILPEDDKKKIEFEIEFLKEQNHLLITAVDASSNTSSFSNSYTGLTNPTIKMTLDAEKKNVDIYVYHEKGITDIEIMLNNQVLEVELPADEIRSEYTLRLALENEKSLVKVVATSVDKTKLEVEEEFVRESELEAEVTFQETQEQLVIANVKCNSVIKEIRINLNGQDFTVPITESTNELSLEIPLVEGNNNMKFTVEAIDGRIAEVTEEFTR